MHHSSNNSLFVLMLLIVSLPLSTHKARGECEKNEWIKETSRSQSGGWIWFPAKAEHKIAAQADLIAVGKALEDLTSECGYPHKKVVFNERCTEIVGGKTIAYIRAAIEERFCRQARNSTLKDRNGLQHPELTKKLLAYRMQSVSEQIDKNVCNMYNYLNCFVAASDEQDLGNLHIAYAYYKAGCAWGDIPACVQMASILLEAGYIENAISVIEKSCKYGNQLACELAPGYKQLLDQVNQTAVVDQPSSLPTAAPTSK